MPRIRCHYADCVFLDESYCGAAAVELDPDTGCQTYTQADEASDEEWEEEEEMEEWEDADSEEDEEDELWIDDEDEY